MRPRLTLGLALALAACDRTPPARVSVKLPSCAENFSAPPSTVAPAWATDLPASSAFHRADGSWGPIPELPTVPTSAGDPDTAALLWCTVAGPLPGPSEIETTIAISGADPVVQHLWVDPAAGGSRTVTIPGVAVARGATIEVRSVIRDPARPAPWSARAAPDPTPDPTPDLPLGGATKVADHWPVRFADADWSATCEAIDADAVAKLVSRPKAVVEQDHDGMCGDPAVVVGDSAWGLPTVAARDWEVAIGTMAAAGGWLHPDVAIEVARYDAFRDDFRKAIRDRVDQQRALAHAIGDTVTLADTITVRLLPLDCGPLVAATNVFHPEPGQTLCQVSVVVGNTASGPLEMNADGKLFPAASSPMSPAALDGLVIVAPDGALAPASFAGSAQKIAPGGNVTVPWIVSLPPDAIDDRSFAHLLHGDEVVGVMRLK